MVILNTFNTPWGGDIMNTENNIIVVTYLTYLLISVTLTIWVARTLYKRGAIFLVDAFHGYLPNTRRFFWSTKTE